jgi:Domain of Unknown Function (DUF928)
MPFKLLFILALMGAILLEKGNANAIDRAFGIASSIDPNGLNPTQLSSIPLSSTLQYVPPPPPEQGAPAGRVRGGASQVSEPLPPELVGDPDSNEISPGPPVQTDEPPIEPPLPPPPLTALVPSVKTEGDSPQELVWAVSAIDRPTFWFFVPDALSPDTPISFVLEDSEGNPLYEHQFNVTSPGGVVSVTLPNPPLEMGKLYHWAFRISDDASSEPEFVEGWVERREPDADLSDRLARSSDREKVALYAEKGFWHDALTQLALLRQANPEDEALNADWTSLLASIGLEDIASAAIVPCCTIGSESAP